MDGWIDRQTADRQTNRDLWTLLAAPNTETSIDLSG